MVFFRLIKIDIFLWNAFLLPSSPTRELFKFTQDIATESAQQQWLLGVKDESGVPREDVQERFL